MFLSGENRKFFIPEIIKDDKELVEMWLLDLEKKSENDIPQGALIKVCESGTFDSFLLRAKERLCTCAQRDVMRVVKDRTKDYAEALEKRCEDEYNRELYERILPYTKGAKDL